MTPLATLPSRRTLGKASWQAVMVLVYADVKVAIGRRVMALLRRCGKSKIKTFWDLLLYFHLPFLLLRPR